MVGTPCCLLSPMQKNNETVKRGVTDIVELRDAIPEPYKTQIAPLLNKQVLKPLAQKKIIDGFKEQADFILTKLPDEDKKGF